MTRLTAMILGTRDDLHIGMIERKGIWGYEISYGENHTPAVTCPPQNNSEEEARKHADNLIDWCVSFVKMGEPA